MKIAGKCFAMQTMTLRNSVNQRQRKREKAVTLVFVCTRH